MRKVVGGDGVEVAGGGGGARVAESEMEGLENVLKGLVGGS